MAIVTQKLKAMCKKSMIMMSIAAMVALYFPAAAAEADKAPPMKHEIRIVKKADLTRNETPELPKEVTPVTNEEGEENSASSTAAHSGYIVISGAGLLLLIILLILLL